MTEGPFKMYTVPETAKILRCSDVNVFKMIRNKEIIAVRFGKRYIVTEGDLRQFIEGHRTEAAG
jgi:excisionase family DNA binding protein